MNEVKFINNMTLCDTTARRDIGKLSEDIACQQKTINNLEITIKALQETLAKWGNMVVSSTEISVNEGNSATFTVTLDEAPTFEQIVNINTYSQYISVTPSEIVFNNDNYSTPQTITVTAKDDEIAIENTAIINLTSRNKETVVNIIVKDNDAAIEWYTLTDEDVLTGNIGAQGFRWIYTFNTDEENVLIPNEMSNYRTKFAGIIPSNIKNLMFEDNVYILSLDQSNTSSLPNTTLESVRNLNDTTETVTLKYCKSLKSVDLSNCSKLKNLSFEGSGIESVPQLPLEVPLTSLRGAFQKSDVKEFMNYTLPNNITDVINMFFKCENLERASLNSSFDKVTKFTNLFFNCSNLTNLIVYSKTIDDFNMFLGDTLGTDKWDYSMYHDSLINGQEITISCYFDSAMYEKIREYQASEELALRNLRLELLDDTELLNISFWGDSLTRRNELSERGHVVKQFSDCMTKNVMAWNYGRGGQNSAGYLTYFEAQPQRHGDISVIWLGTNDTAYSGEQTVNNIKGYISKLTTDKYLVLMPFGWGYDEDNVNAFNNGGFGNKLLNPHDYIIEHGFDIIGKAPTEEEQASMNNDEVPSFFVHTDNTHLNDFAGQVISKMIRDACLSLGYITEDSLNEEGKNTSVTISAIELSLSINGTSTLTATSGNGAPIAWSSTDESVATVSNGLVTGIASGTCYIIARCGSYSKLCTVTVS